MCHLVAVQSAVIMSMSILKPIDGIPVPNSQLLTLVPPVAIRGGTLGFQVIKLSKMKSIKYIS